MPRKPSQPLTPQDWIKTAFRSLAAEGVGAIKAELLAKLLNTTKGSFYWHFKDVPTFRHEMLNLWEAEATTAIARFVDGAAHPGKDRLLLLCETITDMNLDNEYGGLRAEPAIRDWARTDPIVLAAVQRIDQHRMSYVTDLFAQAGFTPDVARSKAMLFYSGFVGMQILTATSSCKLKTELAELVRLLLSA